MDKFTVSVVIPSFNNQDTILRAITSACNQTLKPNEIIVIDDNSNDLTCELVEDYVRKNNSENIFLYKNEINKGSGYSRNSGWAKASSSYIAFLDADDWWDHQKLEILINFFKTNNSIKVCGHTFLSQNVIKKPCSTKVSWIGYKNLLFKNYFSTPAMIVKADLICRFPENMRYAEDYSLWLDIASQYGEIPKILSPLAYCDKNLYGDSGLSKNLMKMEMGELSVLFRQLKLHRIGHLLFVVLATISLLKFIFRVFKTFYQRY